MDYCTLFPEGWWSHCCTQHDADYLAQVGQALADDQLQQCVAQAIPALIADHPMLAGVAAVVSAAIARLMYTGVRLFGRYFYRRAGSRL